VNSHDDHKNNAISGDSIMTTAPVSFGGLESGIDTSSIITAEMTIFDGPLTALQTQATNLTTQISDYQTINSQVLALQQSADALATPFAYSEAFSATSSDAGVATGTITSGTSAGSITLAVDQLATGSTQISSGTVAATNDVVASSNLLLGSGGSALGISSLSAGTGLSLGAHSISVTQASSGATVAGASALGVSTTITSANNEIDAQVNGSAVAVVIPAGTYSTTQLAQAITQNSGGTLSASVNSNGVLSLATTQQGSSSSLAITGGSALSTLNLSSGATVNGTDGEISVDGTTTAVTNIAGNGSTQVTLNSGSGGTITAQLSGGLSVASMTAQNVSVGNGSLSSVVSAINGAGAGVTATALQVGVNQYALEITSQATGVAGASTIDTGAFAGSSLGTMQTTTAAQDAIVSIGGTGGYQVTSATNAVTGVLPGVSLNLSQVSSTPVTISVQPDGSQLVNQVSALVSAANAVLTSISTDTAYNPSTNTSGALNGSTSLSALAQSVLSMVGQAVGSSTSGSDGTAGESAGLAITASGTITFNQSAFETAYDANPTAVQSMFIEGGTYSAASPTYAGQVSVIGATDETSPGSYAVSITQSASQAIDTGSGVFASASSTLASAESYSVTTGSNSATYAATAGESMSSVMTGINAAMAAAGIGVSAAMVGSAGSYQVQLSSATYGSAAAFSVSATGADQLGLTTAGSSYAGTDVEGTIDGTTAWGYGQILTSNDSSSPANGLVLQITTPGISSATSLGTVNNNPGIAQGLANLAEKATFSPSGQLTDTISGLNSTLSNLNGQIALQEQLSATQKAMLTQEFTTMEETLSVLSSESSYLTNASSAASSSSTSSGLTSMSSSTTG
jgi:flagellar hook-associated protein 2